MQKNVNEDLPVEAGYAFDMEDDKSISSPEQNLEVDIDPKERPPRRGHVIEGIISGAEAVSEKFSKIADIIDISGSLETREIKDISKINILLEKVS